MNQQTDFSLLHAQLRRIGNEFKLYRGLPHPDLQSDSFFEVIKKIDVVSRCGSDFNANPVPISSQNQAFISELLSTSGTYLPWTDGKGCGGFHADFCLMFFAGDDCVEVHICFGCKEAKIIFDEQYIRTDLNIQRVELLKETLGFTNE